MLFRQSVHWRERFSRRGSAGFATAAVLAAGGFVIPAAFAAVPQPAIDSVSLLGVRGAHAVAIGKRVIVTVRVRRATTCTFRAQHQPFSGLYLVRTVSCASGHARVTMPPVQNPYLMKANLIYTVRVGGRGGVVEKELTIVAAAAAPLTFTHPPRPTPTATQPAPTVAPQAPTVAPPARTPLPAPAAATPTLSPSTNWSGYEVGGGPFTAIAGTFNVPSLYATATETKTTEWVGIDGVSSESLIQAGVEERYDPWTNLVYTQAWWEILPAPETPILMSVTPGDQVTVAIDQVSGAHWQISVSDDTTGQRFVVDQTYRGPRTSAEWIVEASTATAFGNYVPAVTFGGLGITGTQTSVTEDILTQGNATVAVPSALTSDGFSVAYSKAQPKAP